MGIEKILCFEKTEEEARASRAEEKQEGEVVATRNLYVSGINYNSREDDIFEFFSKFGKVRAVRLITHRDTGRSKGYAFVDMIDDEGAKKAVAADGEELDGRKINVSFARERKRY